MKIIRCLSIVDGSTQSMIIIPFILLTLSLFISRDLHFHLRVCFIIRINKSKLCVLTLMCLWMIFDEDVMRQKKMCLTYIAAIAWLDQAFLAHICVYKVNKCASYKITWHTLPFYTNKGMLNARQTWANLIWIYRAFHLLRSCFLC